MPPIKPTALPKNRPVEIPDVVFDVFNELIKKHWDGRQAVFTSDEACDAVAAALGISSEEVLRRHLLDVEKDFEKAGWRVVYEKTGYNDPTPDLFRFTSDLRGRR